MKKLELLTIVFFLFIAGFGIGSWGYKFFTKSEDKDKNNISVAFKAPTEEIVDFIESDSDVIDKGSDGLNILLLGKGGLGHSGGDLADSIILVHLEKDNKKAVLISIPRDFWFSGHKLNADPSVKDAITAITGLPVDYQISIDFNSFIKAVNDIGGIEIDIQKPYTDNFYPVRGLENDLCGFSPEKVVELHQKFSGFNLEKQFTCRYETIHFDAGKREIDGETALKYVRSRHGDGDFGRSGRQFVVLKGIAGKVFNLNLDKVLDLSKIVTSDMDASSIKSLFSSLNNLSDYQISSVHLSDANVLVASKSSQGAYILLPRAGEGNYREIKEYLVR